MAGIADTKPTSFVGFDRNGIIVGRITLGVACWKVSYGGRGVRHLWIGRSLEAAEGVLRGAGAVSIRAQGGAVA